MVYLYIMLNIWGQTIALDMFYYLSFLRAPPVRANEGQSIVFAPQITNDLRTELCQEELEIYYAWLPNDDKLAAEAKDIVERDPTEDSANTL